MSMVRSLERSGSYGSIAPPKQRNLDESLARRIDVRQNRRDALSIGDADLDVLVFEIKFSYRLFCGCPRRLAGAVSRRRRSNTRMASHTGPDEPRGPTFDGERPECRPGVRQCAMRVCLRPTCRVALPTYCVPSVEATSRTLSTIIVRRVESTINRQASKSYLAGVEGDRGVYLAGISRPDRILRSRDVPTRSRSSRQM